MASGSEGADISAAAVAAISLATSAAVCLISAKSAYKPY
jgi:hypothetical protein